MKVLIPQDYSDITVDEWQRLEKEWAKGGTPLQKTAQCIEVLCGLTANQVKQIASADWNRLMKELDWVMSGEQRDHEVVPRFTIEGVEYGFVPDWSQVTTGEFIDLETFAGLGFTDHLPSVMAVCYRRITAQSGQFYEVEPYTPTERKTNEMKGAPMDAAMGAMVFFLTTARGLANDTLNSLREDRQTRWAKSGVGIRRFIVWLTAMFSKSKR